MNSTELFGLSQKANELRKNENYSEAQELYEKIWSESKDKYTGAGLLHCLRKRKLFDIAVPFANELLNLHPNFDWCKNEIIWTFIEGILQNINEDEPLINIINVANKILNLNPELLALKLSVFKVLKSAKVTKDWDTLNAWVVKVDPKLLNPKPITDQRGREGWSDKSLWYNYRLNGLYETKDYARVISIVNEIEDQFPKEHKFFLRLKGLSYIRLNQLDEAEIIYKNLCAHPKTDWWLLNEYASILRKKGQKEDALKLMYKAALGNPKLELMVSMFQDIGFLCKEMNRTEESLDHFLLCKIERENHGWSISTSLVDNINELNAKLMNNNDPVDKNVILNSCRKHWRLFNGEDISKTSQVQNSPRHNLYGKVYLGRIENAFCFIKLQGDESVFCFKSDLPSGIIDGQVVAFDAVTSFDKKKNKHGWRATNIKIR